MIKLLRALAAIVGVVLLAFAVVPMIALAESPAVFTLVEVDSMAPPAQVRVDQPNYMHRSLNLAKSLDNAPERVPLRR